MDDELRGADPRERVLSRYRSHEARRRRRVVSRASPASPAPARRRRPRARRRPRPQPRARRARWRDRPACRAPAVPRSRPLAWSRARVAGAPRRRGRRAPRGWPRAPGRSVRRDRASVPPARRAGVSARRSETKRQLDARRASRVVIASLTGDGSPRSSRTSPPCDTISTSAPGAAAAMGHALGKAQCATTRPHAQPRHLASVPPPSTASRQPHATAAPARAQPRRASRMPRPAAAARPPPVSRPLELARLRLHEVPRRVALEGGIARGDEGDAHQTLEAPREDGNGLMRWPTSPSRVASFFSPKTPSC